MARKSTALVLGALLGLAIGCSGKQKKMDPEKARKYYNEGLEEAKEGEHEDAIKSYTDALKYHPTYAPAYYSRAFSYLELRKMEDPPIPGRELVGRAYADYSSAISAKPSFADAYFSRAMVLCSRAKYRQAVSDLLVCTRYSPRDAEPHLILGQLYETKFEGKLVLAMKHYESYVKLGGTNGKIKERVEAWKKLKADTPKKKQPSKNDEEKAQELHETFKRLFPQGKEKEALEAIEKLVKTYKHTRYFRARERALMALYNSLKGDRKRR